jgi:FkbM family methyltransferase
MSVPDCVLADRATLEETARRGAQAVNLANGALMCRVLTKYLMFVDPDDLGVTPRLCLDGFWESWVTTALARVLQPGSFCVDVGANHGYYTMLLADGAGPHGRVIALEPNPALAELLSLTLEVNGFERRALVSQQAATDGSAPTVQLVIPRRRGACATICRAPSAADVVVDVDATSVDALTASWPRVDLVKIDAEGAEPAIWRGMRRTIAANSALVVVLEFVASRYDDPRGFLDAIRGDGFPLRHVAHDSSIELLSDDRALSDGDGEGWTLFLQRDTTPHAGASSEGPGR